MNEQVMETDDFFAHYGVKGMKWGRRKVYNDKVNKATARYDRVASGKGNLRDKYAVAMRTSVADLAVNGGLKGTAAAKSKNLKAHQDRINKGQATALDVIRMHGSLSLKDLAAAGRDKNRKQ